MVIGLGMLCTDQLRVGVKMLRSPQPIGLRDTGFRDQIIDLNEIRDGETVNVINDPNVIFESSIPTSNQLPCVKVGFGILEVKDQCQRPASQPQTFDGYLKSIAFCTLAWSADSNFTK